MPEKIANKHVAVITAIPEIDLIYACDPDADRAATIAGKAEGSTAETDFEKVLADPKVEIVSICTPSGSHASLGIQAARAGKHVIVEKPMALRLDEADQLDRGLRPLGCEALRRQAEPLQPPRAKACGAPSRPGPPGPVFLGRVRVFWNRDQDYYDVEPWRGTWRRTGGPHQPGEPPHRPP